MADSVWFSLDNLAEQSFSRGPFGGSSPIVLDTTSFTSILDQIKNVERSFGLPEDDLDEPAPISILSTGCYLNATSASDGLRDCAAACAQPATMFNSSYTFWNCLTLAAASVYAEASDRALDRDSLVRAGETMGFHSLGQFNATQIFAHTLACIQGSCQDYSLGSCSAHITALDIRGADDQAGALWSGLRTYCDGMDSVVNSDIAGPGVVLSYVLQAGLAMAAYFLINLFTSWLQPLLSLVYTVQDRAGGRAAGRTTPWQRAGAHQQALRRSRAAAALTSALVEFQEVQAFFLVSIQVATMVIFARDDHAAMLSSTGSFAEAVTNVQVVQLLSINGLLPVLFTQIGLMRLGMRWWYLTGLVLVVFFLGVYIAQSRLMPDYATLWTYFTAESGIARCGGNPSPMTYCLDSLAGLEATLTRMNNGLIVGCMAVAALLLDQIWASVNAHGAMDEELDAWERTSGTVRALRRRVLPVALRVVWLGLELASLVYVGIYLQSVVDLLEFVGSQASDWTFGQLIAIMVWMPVVGKYLYLNVFGITEGVGRRLHSRYKVVEVDEDEDEGEGDGDGDRDGDRAAKSPREMGAGGIELGLRHKEALYALSRADTLVATSSAASAAEQDAYGRKQNPFDDRFRQHEKASDDGIVSSR